MPRSEGSRLPYVSLVVAVCSLAAWTLRTHPPIRDALLPPRASTAATAPLVSASPPPPPLPLPSLHPHLWDTLIVASLVTGRDAIAWTGANRHTPGDRSLCIDPPPFGEQCTMHALDALLSCARQKGCLALTCPDPAPYVQPRPDLRSTGPVCQARDVASPRAWLAGQALEAGHGMCAPTGCTDVFLEPRTRRSVAARVTSALDAALAAAAGGAVARRVVLLAVPAARGGGDATALGLGFGLDAQHGWAFVARVAAAGYTEGEATASDWLAAAPRLPVSAGVGPQPELPLWARGPPQELVVFSAPAPEPLAIEGASAG